MIELKPIENSSQVAEAAYDAAQRILAVRYKHSAFVYHYKGVPEEVAVEFEKAESKGRFLGGKVRGLYDFERINTLDEDPRAEPAAAS